MSTKFVNTAFVNTRIFIITYNPLVLNNIYAALQGAGFSSLMTQHMRQPLTAFLVWPCWDFSLFSQFLFFFL